jgi:predicted dinucleotide-binding enzyme
VAGCGRGGERDDGYLREGFVLDKRGGEGGGGEAGARRLRRVPVRVLVVQSRHRQALRKGYAETSVLAKPGIVKEVRLANDVVVFLVRVYK